MRTAGRVRALRGWSRGFPGPVSLPAARDYCTSGRPMAKVKVIRRGRLTNEERERGFSLNSAPAPLPTYDALRDNNLRQYFESKTVQKFLQSSGWIDKEGRIVDLDKFRCVPASPLLADCDSLGGANAPWCRRRRRLASVGHLLYPSAGCVCLRPHTRLRPRATGASSTLSSKSSSMQKRQSFGG